MKRGIIVDTHDDLEAIEKAVGVLYKRPVCVCTHREEANCDA
ncbi:MAG: hypothetical protein U9O90_03865 [Euryarchaeota archaeon]|nr:hypothetical protein [Euryarchaeota archaeon]